MILNQTLDTTKNLSNQDNIKTKTSLTNEQFVNDKRPAIPLQRAMSSMYPNIKNLPIFVINLDTDTKRWNSIKSQLDFINSNTYQRVSAVDMRKPNMS